MDTIIAKRISVRTLKQNMLTTLSATPLIVGLLASTAGSAFAQAQNARGPAVVDEIVVTGTRVVRDGYEAPTPVTVVSVDQLQSFATSNVADYLNTLPQLSGSATPQSSVNLINAGIGAINGLNLRNMGVTRTLVLLNGQRIVGNVNTGVVDVSEIPQALIQRVDTVFGGASAAYGSDALTGVVNFVLNNEFVGVSGDVTGGVSDYGDARSWSASVTAGTTFGGGRGHLIISGEAAQEDGIHNPNQKNRDWMNRGYMMMQNPAYGTGAGQSRSVPQQIARSEVGMSNASLGGLITSGPLKGTMFGPGGAISKLNYGSIISNPHMSGGDWEVVNMGSQWGNSLQPEQNRQSVFLRASYAVTDNFEVYGQAQWGHLYGFSEAVSAFFTGSLIVRNDNPLIPEPIRASMAAQNLTSFQFGTMAQDLDIESPYNDRRVVRTLIGAKGNFDAFESSWNWDAHYSDGLAMGTTAASKTFKTNNFMLAIDAVRHPTTGQIVCRSTITDPGNGCVPYNLFGIGVNSQNTIKYVRGGKPYRHTRLGQRVAAASVNGEPFDVWAGPVSLAAGVEYRKEWTYGGADPHQVTGEWFIGSGSPFDGSYSATDVFVETVVPLATNADWAKNLEVNGAVRATHYSTYGTTATWKVGLNYSPTEDLRFRGALSRDIRSPTLVDLYAAPIVANFQINNPFLNGQNVNYLGVTTGNPNLQPESALTSGLGAVYRPNWFPGFNVSFDYYQIDLKDAIASIGAGPLLDLCFAGSSEACAAITTIGTDPNGLPRLQISIGPQNFASELQKGFDIETSYALPLAAIQESWDGYLRLRILATHTISYLSESGIPGTIPRELSGENTGPGKWRYQANVNLDLDPVSLGLTMRGISGGTINNSWITCTSGCPVSTANALTVDYNTMDGATYFDFNAKYAFHPNDESEIELFFAVRNLTNKDPAIWYPGPGGNSWQRIPSNPQKYDLLGRMFRAGLRFKM